MSIFEDVSKKVNEVFDEKMLDNLARKTGALKRKRIITPKRLLETMLFLRLKNPSHSLDDLVLEFKEQCCTVSKTALHNKLQKSINFFHAVLADIFAHVFTNMSVFKMINFVRSVKVIDSSDISLSKKLKKEFPGKRNQGASVKMQVLMDVLTTQVLSFSLHKSTEPDQGYKSHIEQIKDSDLLITDLGYFCIDTFKSIMNQGGYFLSRLFKNAKIYDDDSLNEINLRAMLVKSRKTKLDINIKLGQLKLPCRLVALKLDEESYQKRLKVLIEKRRKDPRLKENISDVLNGWSIFITNLPISVTAHNLLLLYSVRWQIELLFKSVKTFLNMRKIEKSNPNIVKILLYTSMIAVALLGMIILTIKDEEISFYKACKIFVKNIHKFIEYLNTKTICPILWMGGLIAQFALKETRAKRPSTKKLLGLRLFNP